MTESPSKPVVLAVDDTPENLDVVKGILASDYTVKAAINGEMALKIVEKAPPDLILLDIMMPGMSGYEVCEQLKSNPATRDIPVIFLTAMEQTTDEAKGFDLGAADYITKPVNPPILEARVRTHLALKHSMDELQAAYAIIKKQKDRMQEELNVGHTIQMSMLPRDFPAFPERPEFDLHALLTPAREVGGDFYDFFLLDEDHICLVVGDVSGKGVPAALFMAVTQTMIKTAAKGDFSPASIVTRVNDALSSDNPTSMFVTLFLAIIDFRTGQFTYCNAGHNPPYVARAAGKLDCLNQRHGVVMGAMEGLAYGESEGALEEGDALFAFSDGVTEAMDTDGRLYGEERLEHVLGQFESAAAEQLTGQALQSVEDFARGAEQADDITILAYRSRQSGETATRNMLDLTIEADIARIGDVLAEVQAFADQAQLAAGIGQKMGIILDELLNNSISYGFEEPSGHEIDVHVHADANHLTLRVSDDGIPFNPFALNRPDTSLNVDDRQIGGLGVMLVSEMTDSQHYERLSGRNVITLTINLNQATEPKETA
jgi:sigma-B regulation protein RsbU (phosphoserine phosphatase)